MRFALCQELSTVFVEPAATQISLCLCCRRYGGSYSAVKTKVSSNVCPSAFRVSNSSVVLAAMTLSSVITPPYCATYITDVGTSVKITSGFFGVGGFSCITKVVKLLMLAQRQNCILSGKIRICSCQCSEQLLTEQHGD